MNIPFKYTDGNRTDPTENSDCQIRAVALTTGMPYAIVHQRAEDAGRGHGQRFPSEELIPRITEFDFQDHIVSKQRVSDFVFEHPEGSFIVRVPGHVFALLDGIVHDTENEVISSSYHRVTKYWRVLERTQ